MHGRTFEVLMLSLAWVEIEHPHVMPCFPQSPGHGTVAGTDLEELSRPVAEVCQDPLFLCLRSIG